MKTREQSLKWWNGMSSPQKTQICDTNTELIGSVRRWETLTGREIEDIYVKEYMLPRVKEALSLSNFGTKELNTEEIKGLFNDLYK